MKTLTRIAMLTLITASLAACGIKGDVKPPKSDTSTQTSFPVR